MGFYRIPFPVPVLHVEKPLALRRVYGDKPMYTINYVGIGQNSTGKHSLLADMIRMSHIVGIERPTTIPCSSIYLWLEPIRKWQRYTIHLTNCYNLTSNVGAFFVMWNTTKMYFSLPKWKLKDCPLVDVCPPC